MKNSSLSVRRITLSAIFLSLSLVAKTMFSLYIPLFGQNGISVGVSGIFSILPSLLFGPLYGAIVSGLSDLLGYLLKPSGAYLPLLTLTAALGGWLRGVLWRFLQNKDNRKLRIVVVVCSLLLLSVGIYNAVCLSADGVNAAYYTQANPGQTDKMHLISRMLITRTINTKDPSGNLASFLPFVTTGIIGSAALGILLLLADYFLSKKLAHRIQAQQVPRLLTAMILSGVVVTTLNTVILREMLFASWKVLPFAVVWIPRFAEEVLGNTVNAYFVALLLGILYGNPTLRSLAAPTGKPDNGTLNA